jgi:hypothetical protein
VHLEDEVYHIAAATHWMRSSVPGPVDDDDNDDNSRRR